MAHIDDAVKAYTKRDEWDTRGDAELTRAYTDDGLSLREIAKRLEVSVETARQKLMGLGVELRSRGGRH